MRGIAILLVFSLHCDSVLTHNAPGSLVLLPLAFVRAGQTGVSLFFIISGFLLARPFLLEAMGARHVARRNYYKRRALRILPLYYAAVVVGTVATSQNVADLLHSLPYLAFLNSFAGIATPLLPYSAVWWSLATEVQFYLLLPLLPLALAGGGGKAAIAIAVVYAVAYGCLATGWIHMSTLEGQIVLNHSLFGCGPFFLAGAALAWVHLRWAAPLRSAFDSIGWIRRGGADAVLFGALLCLALLLQRVALIGYWTMEKPLFHAWHLLEALLWSVVLFSVLLTPVRTKTLFFNSLWDGLGVLSYSIYVIHYPLLRFGVEFIHGIDIRDVRLGWNPKTSATIVALSIVCVLLSSLTYRFIERPFLVRKERVEQ